MRAEPETPKVIGTTVDGIDYYRASGLGDVDINGDMIFDFCDSAVDQNDAARHNDNIAIAIRANFGIQPDSKLHQDYPDIEEFRIRNWDSDNDDLYEKIEILINHEVVYSSTTDTDQDGDVSLNEALTDLGWW